MNAQQDSIDKMERRDLVWRGIVFGIVAILTVTGLGIGGYLLSKKLDSQDVIIRELRESSDTQARRIRQLIETLEAAGLPVPAPEPAPTPAPSPRSVRPTSSPSPSPTPTSPPPEEPSPEPPPPSPSPTPSPTCFGPVCLPQ